LPRPKKPLTLPKLKDAIEDLLLEELKEERGAKCELCGRNSQLGLFHILPKGCHPRLRFTKSNLLIAGWFCCHLPWHHSYFEARDRIEPRIKELCGDDYEEKLWLLERELPKLDELTLRKLYEDMLAASLSRESNKGY
jgi:hypothetical protein